MSAYLIVDTQIKNPEDYEQYKALASPIVEKYGGEYLVRGGDFEAVETDLWSPTRLVVIQFPSMDNVRAFYDSSEYAPVRKIRHDNARCTVAMVEGMGD